ncbi:MAG: hypothetical protein ABIH52_00270 [Candidatus Aenigmatarchaeota archaeon]
MKIMICGSMHFAKDMMETKKKLEELGHDAEVPCDTQMFIDDPNFTTDNHEENHKHCQENDIIRTCFNEIENRDAILVLNLPKNGVDGYVGASSFMEIGLAYHFRKKIFLLHPPPKVEDAKSSHEIIVMQPTILDGDLSKIA